MLGNEIKILRSLAVAMVVLLAWPSLRAHSALHQSRRGTRRARSLRLAPTPVVPRRGLP
jgi:hypothetical protein